MVRGRHAVHPGVVSVSDRKESSGEHFFDGAAKGWVKLGEVLHRRPVQFISYLVAGIVIIVLLSAALITSTENKTDINSVKSVLCNPPKDGTIDPNRIRQCQELFDRLLQHPTPQQAERLREIVKGK